jgi:hypothetical protein
MSHREDQRLYRAIFPKFTLATLPPAADWDGAVVIITDATPPCLAFSDGTNWIATDDGTTAA